MARVSRGERGEAALREAPRNRRAPAAAVMQNRAAPHLRECWSAGSSTCCCSRTCAMSPSSACRGAAAATGEGRGQPTAAMAAAAARRTPPPPTPPHPATDTAHTSPPTWRNLWGAPSAAACVSRSRAAMRACLRVGTNTMAGLPSRAYCPMAAYAGRIMACMRASRLITSKPWMWISSGTGRTPAG